MKTIYKEISELPDEVREKLYKLRLCDDSETPRDEYVEKYHIVLVDNCLYHNKNKYTMDIVKRYKTLEKCGLSHGYCYLPDVIIQDGCVIKNRFGQKEEVCND